MANSDNKKHNTQIIDNKETTSDLKNNQLDIIERALNPKYPQIIQCVLARCQHLFECWDVGAKWKGDILGCKSPDKLEEKHHENEYVNPSKASEVLYIDRQMIEIIIEGAHGLIKYLPMHRTSIEELIKKLEDCEGIIGIG